MDHGIDRRDFLKLAGLGGVVFASTLPGWSAAAGAAARDFFFVQLSDTHWGFGDARINPDAGGTLKKAVAAVNALDEQPDFVVFTGDLTHTTDDAQERRKRLAEFRDIAGGLQVKTVHFLPGEHDGALDRSEAYQEFFGRTSYTFDHKGAHFIVLDNVSDPQATVGDEQLAWLKADLKQLAPQTPIVVLTHRPLFDLYPQWDWATRDGAAVIDALQPFPHVAVFYGHIHQEHHRMTGNVAHHAAKSLMFPLPAPGSVPKKAPVAWDPAAPYKGLGFRDVEIDVGTAGVKLEERPVAAA
jgi:3',5'-cyclic AMP phosphodiesterase CpdA